MIEMINLSIGLFSVLTSIGILVFLCKPSRQEEE
jgi:hypothetical protein